MRFGREEDFEGEVRDDDDDFGDIVEVDLD